MVFPLLFLVVNHFTVIICRVPLPIPKPTTTTSQKTYRNSQPVCFLPTHLKVPPNLKSLWSYNRGEWTEAKILS